MRLPPARHVLAVVAHPDDESFGLGAILSTYVDSGAEVRVLCFTAGEASSLGAHLPDLAGLRSRELTCASKALGLGDGTLLDHPDGGLAAVDLDLLTEAVAAVADGIDMLVAFDTRGITGHPDHIRATEAAHAAASSLDLPVLEWTLTDGIAESLATEFDAPFVGTPADELVHLVVDRTRQMEAIACHHSQAENNAVLWRRLALQGDKEWVRITRTPGAARHGR